MLNINISKNLAQDIVDAVSTVVDRDINFIDKNGIIIGSTNKERLNLFHEAACEAIKTGEYITVENNGQYEGSQEGINYPIKINNVPIGVIGITGKPYEVSKYGFLVTKITEVFVKEQQLNYKYELDKQKINYVVKSLIYNQIEDRDNIEEILEEFKISKNEKMSVAIIKINKNEDVKSMETTKDEIKRFFHNLGILLEIYIYPNEIIVLLNESQLNPVIESFEVELSKYRDIICCGIGRLHSVYHTYNSYNEAVIALEYSKKNKRMISYIDDLNLEIILGSVDKRTKKYYVKKILSQLSDHDIEILNAYYKNNMSLKLTSEELFIHKNTLQYNLERINSKIGYNPREFKDSVVLYIATLLI